MARRVRALGCLLRCDFRQTLQLANAAISSPTREIRATLKVPSVTTARRYSEETNAGEGPMAAYQRLCNLGQLKVGDRPQENVAAALDRLFQDLTRRGKQRNQGGWFKRSFWRPKGRPNFTRGLYMHGGVGRGKTMLMDILYHKVDVCKKRRVHFHAFMLDVHGRLHKVFQEKSKLSADDSINIVAEELMDESLLLCLDDVEVLWPLGMILVATSNIKPENLYRGGLNWALLEPFIRQLKEHCVVYSLDEGFSTDYRRCFLRLDRLYLYPLVDRNDKLLDETFMALTGGAAGDIEQIRVMMGRDLQIQAANGAARAQFAALCGGPYGAADYIAIAQSFQALFLTGVPWLGDPALEDEARRFITLIDVLYEANSLFVCSAAVSVDHLFGLEPSSGQPAQQVADGADFRVVGEGGSSGRSTLMIGGMEWSGTGRLDASLAKLSGSGPSFTRAAAARAVSRLLEMQSREYLARAGQFGGIAASAF